MKGGYVEGFIKGLCYVVVIILIAGILILRFPILEQSAAFTLFPTLAIIAVEFQMIRKAHLPQAYYLLAVVFNLLFLPFLMGSISIGKKR